MIADIFILIFNLFIYLFTGVITWLTNILPDSPFTSLDLSFPVTLVGYINWAFPFAQILLILGVWAASVGVYLFIRLIMHVLHLE
ncbi:MAG: hypothetical protein PHN26_08920 [Eubacteriaceae bacterium]|nr:hypothetical protein [Eubacteriaceae bacterium]